MSKTLLLIRHAKSSWSDASLPDFERPLNERGNKDAPEMAKRVDDRKLHIDVFVSSPAKRARQTCKYFAREFDSKKKDILLDERLYEAGEQAFLEVVSGLKNKWDVAAIFSHNPGITSFVNALTATKVDDMPTCGVFAVRAKTQEWGDFGNAEKEFLFFDYPKARED